MAFIQDLSSAEILLENLREAVVLLDNNLRVRQANMAFYRMFQLLPKDSENKLIYHLGNSDCAIPALIALLEEIGNKKEIVMDFRIEHDFPRLGRKILLLNVCRFWTSKRLSG